MSVSGGAANNCNSFLRTLVRSQTRSDNRSQERVEFEQCLSFAAPQAYETATYIDEILEGTEGRFAFKTVFLKYIWGASFRKRGLQQERETRETFIALLWFRQSSNRFSI